LIEADILTGSYDSGQLTSLTVSKRCHDVLNDAIGKEV